MTTGQRIKNRRKSIGLSAEQLADFLGCSPATIYRYENGDIEKVPGDRLGTIAKALQTTPAFLMGWDEYSLTHTTNSPSLPHEDGERDILDEVDIGFYQGFKELDEAGKRGDGGLNLSDREIYLIHLFRKLDERNQAATFSFINSLYETQPGEKANPAPKQA